MCKSNNMASENYIVAIANACSLISKYLMSLTFIATPTY